ncbi:hypothetical protein ACFPOI_55695 [Nonomuraea angiospora]|uniref:Uncharacterized membrane protein YfbV (UPF0208 family) n=1 Tax=Nonomuraea angiospora TaxID=46172 RepID=A0ABR9M7I5_9ACTN|nr:hypothetical protein [Nonomuraea angiospora]MBE1588861.1 uncharacterized membrane protein YfbV (UPF0208 family) [Nonomuraea angiospora]
MNVEAEILGLKLRMQALEAQPCPGPVITAIAIAVALVTAEVTDARAEITQDLAAMGIEIEGLRRQTNQHITSAQRDTPAWYDALQHDLNELRLRIDHLLEKPGA